MERTGSIYKDSVFDQCEAPEPVWIIVAATMSRTYKDIILEDNWKVFPDGRETNVKRGEQKSK